jgi:DNA (cytosine-5)-methyltransferase 1
VPAGAYYNEIDRFAAAWLRELIKAGAIAQGDVDERDIRDIRPDELRGYTQCHFFAGIGVWSHALRLAGWPDDRPVWTGSCPCQPFSLAGKQHGFADERHLWPSWYHLISQCEPRVVFGEQVKAAIRQGWLDLVQDDLEAAGYAFGAIAFPACGVGAPHIRQRIYFVADAAWEGLRAPHAELHGGAGEAQPPGRDADIVVHADDAGPQGLLVGGDGADQRAAGAAGVANGFWADAEWIACSDGLHRPVEPGTFPLAHGAAARVGRLRGYGNALVAPQAEAFISAYLDLER